jgi:hypothetical protein
VGTEPTIGIHLTERGALLARHALRAFVLQEQLSDADEAHYHLLLDALVWPGAAERTVSIPGPPHVPGRFDNPEWRRAYMAGYKAGRRGVARHGEGRT